MNCFFETTASARLWLYLKHLYFISSAIAYCISPYASFYAELSCFVAYKMVTNWRIYLKTFPLVHQRGIHTHTRIQTHTNTHTHTLTIAIGIQRVAFHQKMNCQKCKVYKCANSPFQKHSVFCAIVIQLFFKLFPILNDLSMFVTTERYR